MALTEDGEWLDAAIGKVIIGGMTTPWIANGAVMVEGERYALGGRGRGTEVREGPGVCQFHLTGRGHLGVRRRDRGARGHRRLGVRRPRPAASTTRSTARSPTCACGSSPRSGPVRALEIRGGAAYELGVREHDHGVKIQPFPDG